MPEVSAGEFARLGEQHDIETFQAASPAYTELAFNVCPAKICPDADRNPAIQDRAVRQAIAYSVDRERINAIAAQGTSFPAHGILPSFYKSFYEQPADDYPYDPEKAKQILDDAGWVDNGDGPRTKGDEELSFNLYVRSESPYNIQAAKLIAEEAGAVGIDFNVQVVSTDKLYDLTVRKVDGKPAPDLRHVHLGLGWRPLRPELPAQHPDDRRDRRLVRLVLLEPRVRPALRAAGRRVRHRGRARRSSRGWSRSPSATCRTWSSPRTRTWRPTGPTRFANVEPVCPEDDGGDIFCDQISLRAAAEAGAGGRGRVERGRRRVGRPRGARGDRLRDRRLVLRIALASRRHEREPLEVEE